MKTTGLYPRVHIDTAKVTAVGQAGGVLLTETIRASGLDHALSEALSRWRKPTAVHDPGKIIMDLALSLVLGGDALSDITVLRAEPAIYGRVASDPTVSRLITTLAQEPDKTIKAISAARQHARARVWNLAGVHAPDHGTSSEEPLIIDLDASLITAHSEKQHAAPTFKRGALATGFDEAGLLRWPASFDDVEARFFCRLRVCRSRAARLRENCQTARQPWGCSVGSQTGSGLGLVWSWCR